MLTKYKDTDTLILDNLPDREVLKFCRLSKGTDRFCNDEFFRRRSWNLYPEMAKYKDKLPYTSEMSWKNYFLSIVYFREIIFKEFNYNVIEGNPEIVAIIFDKYQRFKNPNIGLNLAVKNGYQSLMKYFISQGASLYNTPIRTAKKYGHHEIAAQLSSR